NEFFLEILEMVIWWFGNDGSSSLVISIFSLTDRFHCVDCIYVAFWGHDGLRFSKIKFQREKIYQSFYYLSNVLSSHHIIDSSIFDDYKGWFVRQLCRNDNSNGH